MDNLSRDDVITLSRCNGTNLEGEDLLATASFKKLFDAGLIRADGFLTENGQKVHSRLNEYEAKLKAGIPFADRKADDRLRAYKSEGSTGWFEATLNKKAIASNGEVILWGKPPKAVEMVGVPGVTRQKLQNAIKKLRSRLKKEVIELPEPLIYQINCLDGVEVVHLAGDGVRVTVQAKYYDLMLEKKPESRAVTNSDREAVFFMEASEKKGYHGIVGLVMPFNWKG